MLRSGFSGNPDGLNRLANFHPSGEIGSPADVAQLALALVQQPGNLLTGASMDMTGGIGMRLHDPD